MITVHGRLLASFFDTQAEPVPVTGRVLFTPNFTSEHTAEGVHLPTRLSVELDDDGRFEVHLLPGDWSWRVEVIAKDQTERTLTVPCFNFLPEPGVDRVNFAEIVPVTDPVTGVPMLRGDDGVGVDAITTAGGELIFTLTNGSETRIPVPQGIPGTGVEGITLQGDELVFTLSDGSEERLPAPKGTPGVAGVGISAITLKDGELVFTLTDGAESRLPAPKGEPGEPGVSPPAPTLSVGNVATLPTGATATASITGTSPDYALTLGIPQGAPGAKGDKGDKGDTPTITAGTVSTLPAGASATADMVPTAGGYALNLGLPAGAPGANGKDAPTPTLAVGTVSTGTASASITGTAPNYTLNLTLPAGTKGETGNPSAMALVGAGRPDTPATLSSANQTAMANAALGATFTSTDGAGTGAWAWVKTPTGWEPTYADTGWPDVTSLASLPANASWATGFAGVFVRRQGGLLTVSIRGLTTTANSNFSVLTLTAGFRTSKNATDLASYPIVNDPGNAFTGKITFWDGTLIQVKTPAAVHRIDSLFTIPTRDPWPSTLPGTPGNL